MKERVISRPPERGRCSLQGDVDPTRQRWGGSAGTKTANGWWRPVHPIMPPSGCSNGSNRNDNEVDRRREGGWEWRMIRRPRRRSSLALWIGFRRSRRIGCPSGGLLFSGSLATDRPPSPTWSADCFSSPRFSPVSFPAALSAPLSTALRFLSVPLLGIPHLRRTKIYACRQLRRLREEIECDTEQGYHTSVSRNAAYSGRSLWNIRVSRAVRGL